MRLIVRWTSILTVLNIVALAIVVLYAGKEFIIPVVAERFYESDYKDLIFKCDSVMKEHFIAKSQVLHSPSTETIADLHAAEVGLLVCHDYDVLRKKLIGYGLSENDLARMGLEAIEERAKDVRPFVESHEIRY